jgi:hypothetical protein
LAVGVRSGALPAALVAGRLAAFAGFTVFMGARAGVFAVAFLAAGLAAVFATLAAGLAALALAGVFTAGFLDLAAALG